MNFTRERIFFLFHRIMYFNIDYDLWIWFKVHSPGEFINIIDEYITHSKQSQEFIHFCWLNWIILRNDLFQATFDTLTQKTNEIKFYLFVILSRRKFIQHMHFSCSFLTATVFYLFYIFSWYFPIVLFFICWCSCLNITSYIIFQTMHNFVVLKNTFISKYIMLGISLALSMHTYFWKEAIYLFCHRNHCCCCSFLCNCILFVVRCLMSEFQSEFFFSGFGRIFHLR